eukprot:s339_g25.t1
MSKLGKGHILEAPLDLEKSDALFPKDSHCETWRPVFGARLETFAWWAYPVYETDERKRDIPFCLDGRGLFYCNAIEGTASAMEMAVIGAKNCVLLASNRLKGRTVDIDSTCGAKGPRSKLWLEKTFNTWVIFENATPLAGLRLPRMRQGRSELCKSLCTEQGGMCLPECLDSVLGFELRQS